MNVGQLKGFLRSWSHRSALSDETVSQAIAAATERIVTEVWPQELDEQYEFDENAAVNIRAQVWAYDQPPRASRVWELWNNETRIESVRPGKLIEDWGRLGNAGRPQKHCIVGAQIWIAPGAGGDVRCTYNRLDDQLDVSDDSSTNYGLTNFSHLYQWLSLARVETYAQNFEGEAAHAGRYESEKAIYNDVQHARRQGGGATGTT